MERKAGKKSIFHCPSLPSLSLRAFCSVNRMNKLTGKSRLCSELGPTDHSADTSTAAQVLTTATACQFPHSEEHRQEKLRQEEAAVSNFCPSCLSEKHTERSQEMVRENFEMNYAFFFVFPPDTSRYHTACIP